MAPERIAVLTSGGDAPGMNACIRSVVRSAIDGGAEAVGIERGFEGLLESAFIELPVGRVGGILDRGGTFLGTSRSQRFTTPAGIDEAVARLREAAIDGLVVIGGDGSFRGAHELHERGVAVVGVPGTIDNDVPCTDTSIGFDTAVNTICDAVSKIRDTASSHERTFVIEVMGRTCGMLALYAGLACGADFIAVPEYPFCIEDVVEGISSGMARGKRHSIIVVAEGCGDAIPMANDLTTAIGHEVRAVVLGHVQRGGSPSAFDRILAARLGEAAVRELFEGGSGTMVGLHNTDTVRTCTLPEAFDGLRVPRPELMRLAQMLAR